MRKGVLLFLLLGWLVSEGYAVTNGLTVNFDNAQAVFIDEDNILKKIDDEGIISDVLSTNVSVSSILLSPQTNLFIVFSFQQQLSDGYSYLLTRAYPTNNTLVGIDTNVDKLRWQDDALNPSVQVDSL